MRTGLQTLSSKLPREPATPTATSLPKTWTQTMIMASHCVGLTLPGMIELPGSFSGKLQFAKARARTGTEPPDVVGDLRQARRQRPDGAVGEDERVVRGERGE